MAKERCPDCGSPVPRRVEWCVACGAPSPTMLRRLNERHPFRNVAVLFLVALAIVLALLLMMME